MKADWIKTRQTRYTLYATLYIVIVVAAVVIVNYLANQHNKSYDSTTNKQFSLSDQTIKVVKNLQVPVHITYYDRQSGFTDPRGNVRDLLDRYAALSNKVKVDYIDPTRKPELAKAAGVKNFGTLIVDANGRQQQAQNVAEEDVTGAIIRAVKGGERTVCVVQGTGEHQLDDSQGSGLSMAKDLLERNNYKTQAINLIQKPEIPKTCTVLLIPGPRVDYIDPVVAAIKGYVEGGGRALIALDPPLNMQRENISENQALANQLAAWGAAPQKDLVVDFSPLNQMFGGSAAVVLVSNYESQPIVRDMKGLPTAFPLSRSIEVKSGDKTSVEKLFSTSEDSLATTNLNSPAINPKDPKNIKGPLVLAAAGTYDNKGRFAVFGSSSWMDNSTIGSRSLANRDLFLNTMNWLSSDEDLISIRPKEPEDRRLTMTARSVQVFMFLTVFFIPLVVIVTGIGVWWRRR